MRTRDLCGFCDTPGGGNEEEKMRVKMGSFCPAAWYQVTWALLFPAEAVVVYN